MTFDQKLNWKIHIRNLISSCHQALLTHYMLQTGLWLNIILISKQISTESTRHICTPTESLHCEAGEPSLQDRRILLNPTCTAKLEGYSTYPDRKNTILGKFSQLFRNKPRTTKFFTRGQ
ncbi:hypothetical protein JTB14_025685 [Gonioctena quinquepunctata]|nr:hypothetical protein JTB14_025685 [Gonioctena quinquepunctata]